MRPGTDELAAWVAGFVVAEGTFVHHAPSRTFTFAVALGAADAGTCEALRDFFGVGSIVRAVRRKPHYDDEVRFQVRSVPELVDVVVPFMDEHLPPSHKRTQYEPWRAALVAHWDETFRRRRRCTAAACPEPQRAKGLCRRHYYEAFGR